MGEGRKGAIRLLFDENENAFGTVQVAYYGALENEGKIHIGCR